MNTVIKSISDITGKNTIASNLPLRKKLGMLKNHINTTKYDILGFVDRSNDVVLRPRYHNVRNELGQFAAIN
jgi:hypothetical protein